MKQAHLLAGHLAPGLTPTPAWADDVPVALGLVDTRPLEAALSLHRWGPAFERFSRRGPWGNRVINARAKVRGRANGMVNDNAVFGWSPPMPVRGREQCIGCAPNRHAPAVMGELVTLAQKADAILKDTRPEAWEYLHARASEIGPDWRFPGTGWTSCIVNDTAQLPYHFDGGNTKGTWSAMVVVRRFVEGGNLHLPDLDLVVPCTHGSVVMFDGQANIHGVTPFRLLKPDAYRFTCVYYQRSGMTKCGTPAEELTKQRQGRTTREAGLAAKAAADLATAAE